MPFRPFLAAAVLAVTLAPAAQAFTLQPVQSSPDRASFADPDEKLTPPPSSESSGTTSSFSSGSGSLTFGTVMQTGRSPAPGYGFSPWPTDGNWSATLDTTRH